MPKIQDWIEDYLRTHSEGADDDELTEALGLKRRQQANQRCRQLESDGLVKRVKLPGRKIRNYWHEAVIEDHVAGAKMAVTEDADEAWYWEGNVQARIVDHLKTTGWAIDHVCDIKAKEKGVDILASQVNRKLGIEVKGYPSTVYQQGPKKGQPKPTPPRLQAKHWFANALMTAILRQTEMPDTQMALGFPHVDLYIELLKKMEPSLTKLGIAFYMVQEDGSVWYFPKE